MDQKDLYKSRPASSKPLGISCVICFRAQSIFSVGTCDHPVCYECSTTMRVLCDQKECPICRRIMTKVIFTKEVDLFKNLDSRQYSRYNKKYGIAFDDHSVERSFEQLMRCYCKKCYDRPDFALFEQLITHMERNHRLYACRLCVKHLKIFPSQRRWYNHDELARHEENGDPDNTSHRGHPECHFCNVRYLDKDELYKHLRKEHFYCHFCDADGIQDYYMSYAWLRKHYHDKHYLCEEGNCVNEEFTSVFRTSIDLQAHKAQTHSRDLGKHGYKEARTLKLEFNLRPRHNPVVEAGRPSSHQPPPDTSYKTVHASDPINVRNKSDFPSLNGQQTTVLPCARTRKQNQPVNTRDLNLFPALSLETPAPPPKIQKPTNNIRMATMLKKPAEPPKLDRNRDPGAGPSGLRLPNQAKDFPSLDGNQQQAKIKDVVTAAPTSANSGGSWVSKAKTANCSGQDDKKKAKKEPAAIKQKIAAAPNVPGPSDFPNLNKKLEPTKSNLAKLGNKNKTDNPRKNESAENQNNNNNNNQNGKKNTAVAAVQAAGDNANSHKKAASSSSSDGTKYAADVNKENNKPKSKIAEAPLCNGTAGNNSTAKPSKAGAATAGKTSEARANSNGNAAKAVAAEPPKRDPFSKKKESCPVALPEKAATEAGNNNNPKDKKKRKKNENSVKDSPPAAIATAPRQPSKENHNQSVRPPHVSAQQPQKYRQPMQPEPYNHPRIQQQPQEHHHHQSAAQPMMPSKIPPGFENSFQQTMVVRAPPGLRSADNLVPPPQTSAIKAPPGLSLTTAVRPPEYHHPVDSTVRNTMLINNLVAALIPVRDERFDTFEKFKEMSTLFRKHLITAYDFYSYCVEALCPHSFESVFSELVLLLPDIQKQQELLYIYNKNNAKDMNVEVCKYCRQLLRAVDVETHVLSVHNNNNNASCS